MAKDFGFIHEETHSNVFMSLIFFIMMFKPVGWLFIVTNVLIVRGLEFSADKFSINVGYGTYLKNALIQLHIKNKSNMVPDPLYAWLKFDHPTMIERVDAADKCML